MKRYHRFLLSILSGVLLSLAWLGFPGWTLFFAFIPLLFVENYFIKYRDNYQSVSFLGHAFVAVLVWNVSTTYWIANATVVGALMAFVVNSFCMASVWWMAHWARRIFKTSLGYFALIVFWISLEYIHYHWDIEWPWLHLGNGFANNTKLIRWYEFTGVLGGTLWVLLVNILMFKIVQNLKLRLLVRKTYYSLVVFFLLLIVPLTLSLVMYYSYREKEVLKNIVIVQPNVDPYSEEYHLEAERSKMNNFLQLAQSKADDSTDFIIGPETVFENQWYWDEERLQTNPFFLQLADFIQQISNAEMIFGVSSFKRYPDKNNAPSTARVKEDIVYDRFNSAIFINRTGQEQIYHKSKLVAGVEKMPFLKYLGVLGDVVINIGGTTGTLGRQNTPSNFVSKDGTKVAPVICYESIFGEYVTGYVKRGAELIFIITNDGWWRNTPGYKQHMSFARLRAIETRRSIARSANTGISCFINQRGDVVQSTVWWTNTAIKGGLNANDKITFYVTYGDFIGRISLFLSILLILTLIVRSRLKN